MTAYRPGTGGVQVFFVAFEGLSVKAMSDCLREHERRIARQIRHEAAYEGFVKTRGALKHLLSARTGAAPDSFEIGEGEHGKPVLLGDTPPIEFSLSRKERYAAIALGREPLGVDIEAVDPAFDWEPVARTHFHPRECEVLAQMPEAERRRTFYRIWTQKESYLKGLGTGFLAEPSGFAVCANGGAVRGPDGAPGPRWNTVPIDAPAGYEAAIASQTAGLKPDIRMIAGFADAAR